MTAEQLRIEKELKDFEKNIFGDPAKKDSLDSIAAANKEVKAKKMKKSRREKSEKTSRRNRDASDSSAVSTSARVTVRRQRH